MSPDRASSGSTAGQQAASTLRITQFKSRNGANQAQIDTLRSLGVRRIGQTVEVRDTPQSRGMLHAVRHLVRIEDE